MAEKEQKQQQKKDAKSDKKALDDKKQEARQAREDTGEVLVRIFGYDIPGSKNIYSALTKIKGISWAISNSICNSMNLDKTKRISTFSKDEIKKIEEAIRSLKVPDFMKNRRLDPETGETGHFYGNDLDMKKDFDIKRMKKMKSYKGIRHQNKLPVRGQRTRSHFRTKGRGVVGVMKKKASPAPGAK